MGDRFSTRTQYTEPDMNRNRSFLVPVAGALVALASIAASVFAGAIEPVAGPVLPCEGYCTGQFKACNSPSMICCCLIEGVWKCVCRWPTECTSSNGCQGLSL